MAVDTMDAIRRGASEVDRSLNAFAKTAFPAIRRVHTMITGVPGGPWWASLGIEYDASLVADDASFREQVRHQLAVEVQRLRSGGPLNDSWLQFATTRELDAANVAPYRYFFA